jgi:hypothetical protein
MTADQAREERIADLGNKMVLAETMELRAALWRQLRAEIAARSPAVVRQMEEQRGLT